MNQPLLLQKTKKKREREHEASVQSCEEQAIRGVHTAHGNEEQASSLHCIVASSQSVRGSDLRAAHALTRGDTCKHMAGPATWLAACCSTPPARQAAGLYCLPGSAPPIRSSIDRGLARVSRMKRRVAHHLVGHKLVLERGVSNTTHHPLHIRSMERRSSRCCTFVLCCMRYIIPGGKTD